jgi:hypothetical protein
MLAVIFRFSVVVNIRLLRPTVSAATPGRKHPQNSQAGHWRWLARLVDMAEKLSTGESSSPSIFSSK